jgi:hypothetical protein
MDLSNGKPIKITDKPLFDKYFRKFPPEISELTFTNLFIWRNYYNFLFLEWKDHLIIFSRKFLQSKWKTPNIPGSMVLYFLPPIGISPETLILELIERINQIEFHKVPEQIIEKVRQNEKFSKYKLEIVDDRDNWDYIYKSNELIELSGNKYRQNRRWLTKFFDQYNYEFHLITEDLIEKTKELQLEWCIMRECEEDESLIMEQVAINEALDNFNELKFTGGLLCVDDKCVAYTFGEKLNSDTLVIHIEKANVQFEGSYQAINNLFLKNCCEDVFYVNREQDLGILGLRRAKESYKPHQMVKKSIVYQKD